MAATRALRWLLAANHVIAEGVMPQLVEGLSGPRKQKDVAVLVGWVLKFFLRFGSQVRGVGDHRQELEAALIFAVLAN
eukprot:4164681-Pleurochrysis_carterae.AAC.1